MHYKVSWRLFKNCLNVSLTSSSISVDGSSNFITSIVLMYKLKMRLEDRPMVSKRFYNC